MIDSGVKSKQRRRLAWTREHLLRERAIALGQAIDISTWKNYGSALNSYLTFVRLHNSLSNQLQILSASLLSSCHITSNQTLLTPTFLEFVTNSNHTSLRLGKYANQCYANVPSQDAND